jgi:hypothetical protein
MLEPSAKAALAELAARPAVASGWMRLAYADPLEHGRLTDVGAHAMEMRYLLLPYAYHQAPWRIAFALDNWSSLTPDGRSQAQREIGITRRDPNLWPASRTAVAGAVRDASGRTIAEPIGLL